MCDPRSQGAVFISRPHNPDNHNSNNGDNGQIQESFIIIIIIIMSVEEATTTMTPPNKEEQGDVEVGYIKTTTQNFVSRRAKIEGAKQVELKGRSILQDHVLVRGDLAIVRIGRYCEIDTHTLLEPPLAPSTMIPSSSSSQEPQPVGVAVVVKKRIPMTIGSHTHIGKSCKIHAAAIGSSVWIGDHVTVGQRCIIKGTNKRKKKSNTGEEYIVYGDGCVFYVFLSPARNFRPCVFQRFVFF
jgi:carbonic anhydrase/acetyltransferase-like protein (isoleucine patch superfamily)